MHMFPGVTVWLKQSAHIGHGAVIHGAIIGKNCLVGMNSVIMDNVELGDECIVGALSFIKADEKFERRSLIAGNPAKIHAATGWTATTPLDDSLRAMLDYWKRTHKND